MATTKIKGSAIDIANTTDGTGITVSSGNDKLLIYDADAAVNKYITVSQLPSAGSSLTPSKISGSAQGFNILATALFTSGGVSLATSGSVTVGTTISGAGAASAASLTTEEATISIAGAISGAAGITGASLTTEDATISVAGAISGASGLSAALLTINGTAVATQAGALVAPTTVSGAGALTGQNLTVATTVSGAGAGSFASLTTEDATISVAGAISGASGVSAALLTINGTAVATQAGALVAPTTVSGAGALTGQNLTVATTVSGAGAFQGQSLTIGNKAMISQAGVIANATTISGASTVSGYGLRFEEGNISSSAGSAVIGGTVMLSNAGTALQMSGVLSSSAGATFLGPAFMDDVNVSGTLTTGGAFAPSAISGNVKLNIFTSKILSNNNIETSGTLVAKTAVSGVTALQSAKLTIQGSDIISSAKALGNVTTISGASVISGLGLTYAHGTISSSAGGAVIGGSVILTKGATSPSAVALKVSGAINCASQISASSWSGLTVSNGGIQKSNGAGISLAAVTMYFNSAYSDGPPAITAFESSSAGGASKQYSTASLKDTNGFLKPMTSISASMSDLSVYKNGLLQRSGGLNSSTADYFFAPQNGGTEAKIHFQYSASASDYIIVKFLKK